MIFDDVIKESLFLVVICSLVPLIICCASSLVISVFQALTQIQEQSISYLVKFMTLVVILWLSAGYFGSLIVRFMEEAIQGISFLGKMS